MAVSINRLKRLLRPRHIAVVGGKEAAEVVRQCERSGFAGEIWPVNSKRARWGGRPCFRHVSDLPTAPDAVFVGVSRTQTLGVARELAAIGASGAVCYASGFAEVGGEGITLQEKLVGSLQGMAMIGPNCYGFLNYLDGVALWPDQHGGERVEKGVAIVLQSGNIGLSLTMQQRGLDVAYLISVGNQAGVTLPEYIECLIEDERVTAVGLHIEGVQDVGAFARAAVKALGRGVPIVALKTGTSARGRELTLSHTSSLAGPDALFDALFARVGVMRVQTLPHFLEALKLLSVLGPLPGAKIASISCSGGEAALVADTAERLGLKMPALTSKQSEGLAAVLGDKVSLNNPLDYHTYIWGDGRAQQACFEAMLGGEQDVTLSVLDFPRPDRCEDEAWRTSAEAFVAAVKAKNARGILLSTLPENMHAAYQKWLAAAGVAPMLGLEECLLAVKGATEIYAKRQQLAEIRPLLPAAPLAAEAVCTLDEAESKRLLRPFGIPTPDFAVCTAAEVGQTAATLGFPVALKILSDVIIHKTEVGGVALNLANEEAVACAAERMDHLGDRFLVEKMAPSPVAELILGITRDPQFGLALVLGSGGIFVELLQDSVTLLLPTRREEVEQAVASLRIAPLLAGHRGQKAGDVGEVVTAVLNLARFAEMHADKLLEVDINPLFVLPAGVVAVDAVVRLG